MPINWEVRDTTTFGHQQSWAEIPVPELVRRRNGNVAYLWLREERQREPDGPFCCAVGLVLGERHVLMVGHGMIAERDTARRLAEGIARLVITAVQEVVR